MQNKLSVSTSQTTFDQIRDMTRTAIRLPGTFNVGDRITFTSSDEPSGIDRYVSHVESLTLEYQLVCFVWPLADGTRALVNLIDDGKTLQDAAKFCQVLKTLRANLK